MNDRKKRSFFICGTPYHIYIAVSIVITEALDADIYILDNYEDSKEYASKLKKMGIFSEVYFIKREFAYRKNHALIEKVKYRLNVNSLGKKLYMSGLILKRSLLKIVTLCRYMYLSEETNNTYIDYSRNYSSMYFSCGYVNREAFLHFKKFGHDFRFVHFEDGAGTYCSTAPFYICEQFRGIPVIDFRYTLKLYDPKLYLAARLKCMRPEKLERIARLERCEKNDMIINTLFAKEEQCSIWQKSIILDTVYNEIFVPNGTRAYKKLLEAIEKAFAVDGVVYKYHPRENTADLSKPHIIAQNVPFEVFCYWNDFSDKTIISICSTGAFTPKLLFDQEPKVIFLYKLLRKYLISADLDEKLFINFKNSYRDKSRVMIPETVSEFKEMLKSCCDSNR